MSFKVNTPQRRSNRVSCVITTDHHRAEAWYRVPEEVNVNVWDPFLIASLLPAMTIGGRIEVAEPVSPKLLGAVPRIQDILLNWNRHRWLNQPRLRMVEVEASVRRPTARPALTGAFFTGGVDSFYTALKHLDQVDALVYVRGFDIDVTDDAANRTALSGIKSAAGLLGKPLVEIASNLRVFAGDFIDWGPYHGAALGSVCALLGASFGRIFVPASFTYARLPPWGSHPILDPLWSTDEVEIVHDGCESNRVEKLAAIAGQPAARSWLRVCLENRHGSYNCGRCEKCLRTMVLLRAMGKLDSFTAFPPLDAGKMYFEYKPRIPKNEWIQIWEDALSFAKESGKDPELEDGIRDLIERERPRPGTS
jgi:hypothetical protein